jgi:hypothetical protein
MQKIKLLLLTLILLTAIAVKTQEQYSSEEYITFLKDLNRENLDIDYKQFRISYIYSEKYKEKATSKYYHLKKKVSQYVKKKKTNKIINACQKMLAIDYTSMFAHQHIQKTAKSLGNSTLHKRHHDLEFGLLKSIVHNKDGKSCETAWEITQLEEKYFILNLLGVQIKQQELKEFCDQVDIKKGTNNETYYLKLIMF